MASAVGTENTDLALAKVEEEIYREPYSFDFFQAMRVLGWLTPSRSPVGRHSNPEDEVVRLGANPILYFPPSAIHSLTRRPGACPTMVVNFMGLIGPLGAMPNYITELIGSRLRTKDATLLAFLNIFNHRLISFFYRAWEKTHFWAGYERDRKDLLTGCLFSLIGFGTAGLRSRQAVEDESFIYYAGLFALCPKSALALESVLGDYFDIPVEVEPFIGTWRTLAEPDHCVCGSDTPESNQVGLGAVVGEEIWDVGSRVRLKVGPLTAARYNEFLPTGSAWPALRAICRSFCGNDLEFEVQLFLLREEVPACQLRNPGEDALCLGWHTWLKSHEEFDRNPGDALLLT